MFKYLLIVVKELPLLIRKYFLILKNYLGRKEISSVKRYNDIRNIIKEFNKRMSVKLILTGLNDLPSDPSFILTPNHQSFMDAICLIDFMKQNTTFVAKKESKKYFYVGKAIGSIDCLYLDRNNLRQEIEVMKKIKQSLLEENRKWIIFPEGTRTREKDYSMNEFKAGSFKMAVSARVDIYPVALWGSFRILDAKETKFKQYPIYIHICEPIRYEMYKDMSTIELSKYVEDIVRKKVNELRELDKKNLNKYLKKKYIKD